jgi:hypothetical protein
MSSAGSVPFFATGQDVLKLAQRHVSEKYVLGVRVPKDNASWTGPWDCAEFASWLIFQTRDDSLWLRQRLRGSLHRRCLHGLLGGRREDPRANYFR